MNSILQPAVDGGIPTGRRPRKSAVVTPPPLPKTEKGRRRRQSIIDAAAEVVDEIGYSNLSVAHISDRAEAPIGLYYRYFRNKADPVLAALEQELDRYSEQLLIEKAEPDFFRAQAASFVQFERLFRAHPGLLSCYYSYEYGEPSFSAFFHDRTLTFDRLHLERTMQLLGENGPIDALMPVSHFLVAMVDNVVFRLCTGRDQIVPLAVAADVKLEELVASLRQRLYTLRNPVHLASGLATLSGRRRTRTMRASTAIDLEILFKRQPKRADSSGTLEAVLAVTLSLLNRHALDDMRIKDVEEQAGITRGVIYHYFNEKRDLAWAAVSGRLEHVLETLEQFAEKRGTMSPDAQIIGFVGILVAEYARNPGVLRSIYQFESGVEEGPRLLQFRSIVTRQLANLLADVMDENDSTPTLSAIIAYVLLAAIDRFCYDLFVVPFAGVGEHLADEMEATHFLSALVARMILLRDLVDYEGSSSAISWLEGRTLGG